MPIDPTVGSFGQRRAVKFLAGALLVPLAALTLAACGGSSSSPPAAAAPAKTAGGTPATVAVAKTDLGNILVDSQGRTLYLFKADSGTKSACSGACAAAWPPLRASGKPTVGNGAKQSLVATTARSDGKPQVTYNGHPLYLYAADKNPGDTNGQGVNGFGAPWFALTADGTQVSGGTPSNSGY